MIVGYEEGKEAEHVRACREAVQEDNVMQEALPSYKRLKSK